MSSSILDYVLVTPDLTKEVVRMIVDEDLNIIDVRLNVREFFRLNVFTI